MQRSFIPNLLLQLPCRLRIKTNHWLSVLAETFLVGNSSSGNTNREWDWSSGHVATLTFADNEIKQFRICITGLAFWILFPFIAQNFGNSLFSFNWKMPFIVGIPREPCVCLLGTLAFPVHNWCAMVQIFFHSCERSRSQNGLQLRCWLLFNQMSITNVIYFQLQIPTSCWATRRLMGIQSCTVLMDSANSLDSLGHMWVFFLITPEN